MSAKRLLIGLFFMSVVTALPAWGAGSERGHSPRTPPQEAIDACKDKSEGASVEITTPRGDTLKCICRQLNGQLVAVPERGFSGSNQPSGGKGP